MGSQSQGLLSGFKLGYGVGNDIQDKNKERAKAEAYNILTGMGGEAEYDTITDKSGAEVKAIPTAPAEVAQARGGIVPEGAPIPRVGGDGLTEQQRELASQAGGMDIPQKISLVDHVSNRRRARDLMREAGVSGEELLKFDDDYTKQMSKNATKYRDAALNAWKAGDYDRAAKLVESSYQYIADGSDARATFQPTGELDSNGNPKMALSIGFQDSLTGESSQETPMLIRDINDFAVMSEKALDYGRGLGMQKDLLAIKTQEEANKRAESKFNFWDTNKDTDRKLDNLFKLAKVENDAYAMQAKLVASLGGEKAAKQVLAREKNLLAEIDRRALDDKTFSNPDTRQDVSATASALNRIAGENMGAAEIIETSKYITNVVSNADRVIQDKIAEEKSKVGDSGENLPQGHWRRKAALERKNLLFSTGALRYAEDGTVEMRAGKGSELWVPAPPRIYNGKPLVTGYSMKSSLLGVVASRSKGDTSTVDEIRRLMGMPGAKPIRNSAAAIAVSTTGEKQTPTTPPPIASKKESPKKEVITSRVKPEDVVLPTDGLKKKGGIPSDEPTGRQSRTEKRAKRALGSDANEKLVGNVLKLHEAGGEIPKELLEQAIEALPALDITNRKKLLSIKRELGYETVRNRRGR